MLLLVSAALATRGGEQDAKIAIVDPKDPSQTMLIEEKYPGESQWSMIRDGTDGRLSQIQSEEDRLKAAGKIDEEGRSLKNHKNEKDENTKA